MNERFNEAKWEKTGLLLGIDDKNHRQKLAIVLENQRLFNENQTETDLKFQYFKRISIPILKRVFSFLPVDDFYTEISHSPYNDFPHKLETNITLNKPETTLRSANALDHECEMVADIAVKLGELLCKHIANHSPFTLINLGLNLDKNEIVVFYDDLPFVLKPERNQTAVS